MKKVSGLYILMLIMMVVTISIVTGVLCNIFLGYDFPSMVLLTFILVGVCVFIFNTTAGGTVNRIMKKTISKNKKDFGFAQCCTFYSSNGIIMIDVPTGQIGYVSYLNPFEFQVISAGGIENITSDYIRAPLGGTNYVYFQFFYNKKKTRVPTFVAQKCVYSLNSREVLEAISKADAYAEMLKQAKSVAMQQGR